MTAPVAVALSAVARAAASEDALDLDKVGEMERLLGSAATARLLEKLKLDLAARLSDARVRNGAALDVAADAHACVSAAGMLGFSALSRACAALETACRVGGSTTEAAGRALAERDRALALLEAFRKT